MRGVRFSIASSTICSLHLCCRGQKVNLHLMAASSPVHVLAQSTYPGLDQPMTRRHPPHQQPIMQAAYIVSKLNERRGQGSERTCSNGGDMQVRGDSAHSAPSCGVAHRLSMMVLRGTHPSTDMGRGPAATRLTVLRRRLSRAASF